MKLSYSCAVLLICANLQILSGQSTSTHKPGNHGNHKPRVVCYFSGWARYRPDPVQFHPEDVDSSLCTHLIYAFASVDDAGQRIVPEDVGDIDMYRRLTSLKRENPKLKVYLGVGGWNMGTKAFTAMVSSSANMHIFANNAIEYLHLYDFDGLDVDWEYPAARGSPPEDKQRFTTLLKVLKKQFNSDHSVTNRTHLHLTTAINPNPYQVNISYELQEIEQYLDFINLMTYDMHGSWESTVGHHSSLYSPTSDKTDSIDYVINWILNTSISKDKLNLGLSFYGRTYKLADASQSHIGASVLGGGVGGSYTQEEGIMAYYEVCKIITDKNATIGDSGRLTGTHAPYMVDGDRWTGYDDVISIQEKVNYAIQMGLGGVFIWAIDMDDFHGICGGGHYPLMNSIHDQIHTTLIG